MAVDKQYLKENNLTEVYKRIKAINEYVITNGHTTEADEMQPEENPQDMNAAPNAMPQDQNMPQQGLVNDTMDGMPESDPTIGAESPETPMSDETVGDNMGMGDNSIGEDDEVLDVDDLTNSQEAAEYKIDGVNDKLTKLMAIAGKFAKAIEDNEAKLEDLKTELERRNPTDMEKINLRSQNSQPFNVAPSDYWKNATEKNPNYQVVSDNEVSPNEEDKVYTITDDDLRDFKSREVEKSFGDIPKDLMGYF